MKEWWSTTQLLYVIAFLCLCIGESKNSDVAFTVAIVMTVIGFFKQRSEE